MPKPPAPESFEVTSYGAPGSPRDRYSVIYEILNEIGQESPAYRCRGSLQGNQLKITYHCYEMHLAQVERLRQVEDQAKQVLDEVVRHLKKEFKARHGEELVLKEKKDLRDYSMSKVSLNERYVYASWRVFELPGGPLDSGRVELAGGR
jgi:hypothetical protein